MSEGPSLPEAATRGASGATGDDSAVEALLVVALTGVQQLIAQARTTADLWGGSTLSSLLALKASLAVEASGGQLILPSLAGHPLRRQVQGNGAPRVDEASAIGVGLERTSEQAGAVGFTNRIVAAVPRSGAGLEVAVAAGDAMRMAWRDFLEDLFGAVPGDPAVLVPGKARWVLVERRAGELYADLWERAQQALVDRKRVRDFTGHEHVDAGAEGTVCALCALRHGAAGLPARVQRRAGERLCHVCAVKRTFRRVVAEERFPSTGSVASAPFRARLLDRLADGEPAAREAVARFAAVHGRLLGRLRELGVTVPRTGPEAIAGLAGRAGDDPDALAFLRVDGAWCFPERWEPETVLRDHGADVRLAASLEQACGEGAAAAGALRARPGQEPAAAPAAYLAVLVQDADDMGKHLTGVLGGRSVSRSWHERVGGLLLEAAGLQAGAIEGSGSWARVVYAGGDDLLAVLPAATALAAAERGRRVFGRVVGAELPGATASAAMVLFHHSFPLQRAISRARETLQDAKRRPGKNRLAPMPPG